MIGRNGIGFMSLQLTSVDADFDFHVWFVSFPGRVLVEEQPLKLLKARTTQIKYMLKKTKKLFSF